MITIEMYKESTLFIHINRYHTYSYMYNKIQKTCGENPVKLRALDHGIDVCAINAKKNALN